MRNKLTDLVFLFVILVSFAHAQSPANTRFVSLTTVGPDVSLNVLGSSIQYHKLSWVPIGTVTTCTIALDSSPDNITFTSGGAIVGQTCTSAGSFTSSSAIVGYVRMNLTTFTGGGTLLVTYAGYTDNLTRSVTGSLNANVTNTVTVTGSVTATIAGSILDPCASSTVAKSSVFANLSSATTTALVPVSGSTTIYVCGFTSTSSSTVLANTFLLEQGTGSNCSGSPTALTATFSNGAVAGSNEVSFGGGGQTIFKTAASNGLCVVSTVGTLPTIALLVTYVQQ